MYTYNTHFTPHTIYIIQFFIRKVSFVNLMFVWPCIVGRQIITPTLYSLYPYATPAQPHPPTPSSCTQPHPTLHPYTPSPHPYKVPYNKTLYFTQKTTHINYKQQTTTAFHHITNTIHTSPSKHYNIQITPVDKNSLFIFSRFGHKKAVLTNVLLKMGIIMLETCWENKPAFCCI
jgi:hypothetical protein